MSEYQAVAHLLGEIANDLSVTPGGLLNMNILVKIQAKNGGQIPNYIPVKWFGDGARSLATMYGKGQMVEITAFVRMNKRQDEKYYQIQLVGDHIRLAHANEEAPIDTPDDGIPWD